MLANLFSSQFYETGYQDMRTIETKHHAEARLQRGASYLEYMFLVSLIAVVAILAIVHFRDATGDSFSTSSDRMEQVGNP